MGQGESEYCLDKVNTVILLLVMIAAQLLIRNEHCKPRFKTLTK